MPAAAGAVIAAASAAAAGTTIFGLSIGLSAVLIGVGSFALNTLGQALTPKPKKQNFGELSSERTQQVKQPITERRIIYGECKVSGPVVYFGSTENNRKLHIVIALATHRCNYLGTTWFNDDPIHPADLNSFVNGNVVSGKFANYARIKKHLGQPGQMVDPDLLAEIPEITDSFVGNSITYIAVTLVKNETLYKSGLPNITQWVQGALVYDTRTATSYWNPNPALCLMDYYRHTKYGMSTPLAKFITDNVTATANSCDEMVAVKQVGQAVSAISTTNDTLTINSTILQFQTGDRVHLTTQGTIPSGLATGTNYYVIVEQPIGEIKIKLASSYANALSRTAVDITSTGAGQVNVIKNAEPRYTCNGTLGTGAEPRKNISDILSAMAGDIQPIGGKWVMKAGVWVEPEIEIGEDDLIGPIERQSKRSRRERFNAVQGLYVTPVNFGEPTDYPLVKDTTYLTEDGVTEPIIGQLDLPMTSRASTAQRVARVKLNQHRRQRTVQITTNLKGMQLQSGDTFMLTHTNSNYNQKIFEVVEFNLVPRRMGKHMVLTCDMMCNETDSAIYDFDETTQEVLPSDPQTTTRADPDFVQPPGAPSVVETKYTTTDGSGVKVRGDASFTASPDFFVRQYLLEYKLQADSTYIVMPPTTSTQQTIYDLAPGKYDVRVKAISIFDAHSAYATGSFTIIGLKDLPVDVDEFSVVSLADNAVAQWKQATDLDVRIGGTVRIRHTPDLINYAWENARDISDALPGIATTATLPILPGVYMAKFVDSVGNESQNAAIIIMADVSAIQKNALATLTAHPTFAGTKVGVVAIDNVLRLDGTVDFDDVAGNFDDAEGVFDSGGGGGQVESGIYKPGYIDCGKVVRVFVSTHVLFEIYNALDLFDYRSGNFDDGTGYFDGEAVSGITIKTWVRTTDDDPGSSPTWGEWQPFIAGYFTCRGLDFSLEITNADTTLQIDISEFSASADVPDVTDSAKTTTSSGSLKTVSFNKTFTAAPDVIAVVNDATEGDVVDIPVANITSSQFDVGVLNSAAYVVRNITWYARGY